MLSASGVTGAVVTVVVVPSQVNFDGQIAAYALSGNAPPSNLVICDAASLGTATADNAVLTVPWTMLSPGMAFTLLGTSSGLTVSSVPPALAVVVDVT